MNTKDLHMLTNDWNKHIKSVEGVIEDTVKSAQDYAYQMGLERGQGNMSKVIKVLEQVTAAIDDYMIGKGTELERLNGIEEAYSAVEELYKEVTQ